MYIVQWSEEYWRAANEIDGGTGLLHEFVAQGRLVLTINPYLGQLEDPSLGLYGIKVPVLRPLLTVRIAYQVDEPFVNLLRVGVVPD